MFAFLIIALGLVVFSSLDTTITHTQERYDYYRSQNIAYHIKALGDGLKEHYFENPSSGFLSPTLVSTRPGFEYLRFHTDDVTQFEVTTGLNDSLWKFDRFILWFESPRVFVGKADYLSAAYNGCGVTDFYTSESWCGHPNSLWLKFENRENRADLLVSEKQRMQRTLQKFLRRYSDDQRFTTLTNGSFSNLATLAGYSGSALNCQGNYIFEGIPLTCDDFFNYWGNPITFNQISGDHIALVNRTGVLQSSGQFIRLAEEARLE